MEKELEKTETKKTKEEIIAESLAETGQKIEKPVKRTGRPRLTDEQREQRRQERNKKKREKRAADKLLRESGNNLTAPSPTLPTEDQEEVPKWKEKAMRHRTKDGGLKSARIKEVRGFADIISGVFYGISLASVEMGTKIAKLKKDRAEEVIFKHASRLEKMIPHEGMSESELAHNPLMKVADFYFPEGISHPLVELFAVSTLPPALDVIQARNG